MEKDRITTLWIVLLVCSSALYAIYSTPEARDPALFTLGVSLGKGLPILFIALIPALIIWSFFHFSREKLQSFIFAWAFSLFVTIVVAELSRQFAIQVVKDRLEVLPVIGLWTDDERAVFVEQEFTECTRNPGVSPLQLFLIGDKSVEEYCTCKTIAKLEIILSDGTIRREIVMFFPLPQKKRSNKLRLIALVQRKNSERVKIGDHERQYVLQADSVAP